MKLLDLQALKKASEQEVELSIGTVCVRRLHRSEYLNLLPPNSIPEDLQPKFTGQESMEERRKINDDATSRQQAWYWTLPTDERIKREWQYRDAMYAAAARAVFKPDAVSMEDIRRLSDRDFLAIWKVIMDFWSAEDQVESNGAGVTVAAT